MNIAVDQATRIQRIAEKVRSLASEEVPSPIEDIDDGPLGEIEREVNRAILALDNRLQERLLFSVGPVVVFRWRNTEGWPVEYVSPNVADLTGFSAAEYLSSAQIYAAHIPKEDLPRVMNEVQTFSASGVDWFVHEPYRLLRRDGRTIWVSDYSVIRRNAEGEITHYFGYIFDITERVEQSQKLVQNERTIQSLASPVLRVWEGILAVPLFGAVDEARAASMTNRLLEEISHGSISYCILDLTGMDAVDAATMEYLVRMVRAVSLLGSTCLLSGISPEVAKMIVELELDVSNVATFGTLSAALRSALGKMTRPRAR